MGEPVVIRSLPKREGRGNSKPVLPRESHDADPGKSVTQDTRQDCVPNPCRVRHRCVGAAYFEACLTPTRPGLASSGAGTKAGKNTRDPIRDLRDYE